MQTLSVYNSGRIHLTHTVSDGYKMEAMHIHDVYEIYFSLSDNLRFFVNDRIYQINRHDVLLFNSTDLHKICVPSSVEYDRFVITFPPELMKAFSTENLDLLDCFDRRTVNYSHRLSLSLKEAEAFLRMIQGIQAASDTAVYGHDIKQRVALIELLLFINQLMAERDIGTTILEDKSATYKKLRAITDYIDEHFTKSILLDELAAVCFLNKHYLCRLFKRETGFCIHDYVTYRRLSYAIALLRDRSTVSEAAQLSGFHSDTYFITTFKRYIGMTPFQYTASQLR